MSIVENEKRVGRFTSSMVHVLMANGRSKSDDFSVTAHTYIDQKYYERKLKRSLDLGRTGQSALWGLFLEQYVYSHFTPLEYEILSSQTCIHPDIDYLAGSVDVKSQTKVGDIKCFEPLKFCQIVDCFEQNDPELFKKKFPKEYWQLVSNAMIHGVSQAESIVYMPTEQELIEIQEMAYNYDGADQWKYRFIYEGEKYTLPYIPDGSEYKNFNKFLFEVPEVDKALLSEKLRKANDIILSKQNGKA